MSDQASLVLNVDSRSVKTATTDLNKLASTSKGVETSVDRLGTSAQRTSTAFSGLSRVIGAAAAVAAAAKFAQAADQMTNLESRIRLTMKATEDYAAIQGKLADIARGSVSSLSDVGTLYARIAPSIQKMGGAQKEAIGIVTALNASLRINGASTSEASSAITQFSQAMQSGILRGEEFNALNENAGPLLDRLAKNLGVTRGELRGMAQDGQLTADVVANGILPSVAELAATSASMGATVSAAFQDMSDDARIAAGQLNDMTGATDAVAKAINSASKEVTDFMKALRDGNLSEQQLHFVGIAGAVATVGAGLLAARSVLTGLTVAMWAFNVAVRANPLIMGFSIIAAGIAAIYGYEKATEGATSSMGKLVKAQEELDKLTAKRPKSGTNALLEQMIAAKQTTVDNLTKVLADEAQDAAIDAQIDIAAAMVKAASAGNTSADSFAKLTVTGGKAGDEISKAMAKAAKAAEDAAQKVRDAKRAIQSSLDDKELAAAGLSGEAISMLNDPNATGDNIRQLNKIEEQEALADATKKAEQAAKDSAAAFDELMSKNYGADLAAGFDKASAALGQFANGFNALIEINADYEKGRKLAGGNDVKLAANAAKTAKAQIAAYGDIAGAAKGFFKEGSKGYKAMETAEKVFRAFQLAMSIKTTAAALLGDSQKAVSAVASGQTQIAVSAAVGQAKAVEGVAGQASGDPYTAFPRMAAMAAIMAGLGFAVGFSGRGDSGKGFTDNTGTGTVFGDPSAQSESISKSIDLLADSATLENRISSAMLASLKSIESNIGGLTNLLVRSGGAGEGLAAGVKDGFKADFIGSTLGKAADFQNSLGIGKKLFGIDLDIGGMVIKALGGLFGSKSKITGQGLTAVPEALADILANGFDLLEFVAVQTKKKSFGITTSTKNSIQTAFADAEIANQFTLIFQGMADAITFAGDALGRDVSGLNGVIIDIGKVDLKGLSQTEQQEKLNAVFSAQADKMAQAALAGLESFIQAGEGYFETVVRVASGVEVAANALERLGLTAIDYTQVINKQGDVGAEIVRQSILMVETSKDVVGGFAEIIQNAQGSAVELVELAIQLRELQDAITATGKAGEYMSTFMIAGAGGIDKLTDGLSSYFDDFLTPAEQTAELVRRMGVQFANLGQMVPQSIDGFRDLVDGIDISTEAGQKLYGQVIALAPAFKDLQDALGDTGFAAAIKDAEKVLTDALSAMRAAVTQAESDLRTAYNAQANELKNTISQFDKFAESLRTFRESLAFTAAATSGGLLGASRSAFSDVASRARLGDTQAMTDLPTIGNQFVQASAEFSASREDYLRDLAFAQNAAAAAEATAGRQKSIAELQLEALTEEVGALIDIKDGTLEVRDAINNLKQLQTFENKAIADTTAAGFGALITSNNGTLTAIQAGTKASQDVQAAISGLLDISARQEAARIAEAQEQQRQIELAAQAEAERKRLVQISELQGKGATAVGTYGETKATIDEAVQLITSRTLGGDRVANELSNSAANASFARGGLGESISDAKFLDVTGGKNQTSRENQANAAANAARYGELSALDVVRGGLNSQLVSSYNDANSLRQQIISLGGVPAFAKGGDHSGGWRMVGENGPELEYTGPSRIYSASQSSSMLNNDDLKAEVSGLRNEMRQALYAIAKSTGKTADQLRNWDDGGRMNVRVDNDAAEPVITREVA